MEENTFNRLRRVSLEELVERLQNIPRSHFPPCPFTGPQNTPKNRLMNMDVLALVRRVQVIEESGWTVEELDRELEKNMVIDWVTEFNTSITIPQQILDSARRYFPNVRFIPAKIELE